MQKFHDSLDFIQIGKIFAVFALLVVKVLKKAIAQIILRVNFCNLLKIYKNCEGFQIFTAEDLLFMYNFYGNIVSLFYSYLLS